MNILRPCFQLRPTNLEQVWDDVPTDEDKRRTISDNEFDSDVEEGDLLTFEGINGEASMDE